MEKLDMNTLKNIIFGTEPINGEKIAGFLIIAMVIYLFIAQ
jgi:hypothetical protein